MDQQLILGASRSVIDGTAKWPIHGLRHPADGETSGWYVWSGEFSDADDFFEPWHHAHVVERWPQLLHLLDLPPGSRFLVVPGFEDVWQDPTLLDV
jgi:hypothetical protein